MRSIDSSIIKKFLFDLEMGAFKSKEKYPHRIEFKCRNYYQTIGLVTLLINYSRYEKPVLSNYLAKDYEIHIGIDKKDGYFYFFNILGTSSKDDFNEFPDYLEPYISEFSRLFNIEYDGEGSFTINGYNDEIYSRDNRLYIETIFV